MRVTVGDSGLVVVLSIERLLTPMFVSSSLGALATSVFSMIIKVAL